MRGLHPEVDGVWRVSQLLHELQCIIHENLEYFNGEVNSNIL